MTDKEIEVLRTLGSWRPEWGLARTMDLGGRDCSHHSYTLSKLVSKGLAERKRHNIRPFSSGHWRYLITDAGKEALNKLKEQP